ncbi:NifB/NifX family molybdenum-iron cluster-binding protein [Desulfurivibrio sp. D14AmB]|uniref:NifB/NifX family molybdenum-iron cluster-binding protein n=1 Tax=Desulfurivibrio sp. D14AmB TaxID=3374370 RepID=UPI00376EB9A6
MKVAVSSTGKELTSPVDPRFGRADYLLLIETTTGEVVEVIDNRETAAQAQGAGIAAAGRLAEAGARAILTGVVGPKAAQVCERAGIAMVNGASGTVAEAIAKFNATPPPSPTDQAVTPTSVSPGRPAPGAARSRCRAAGGPSRDGQRAQGRGNQGRCRRTMRTAR